MSRSNIALLKLREWDINFMRLTVQIMAIAAIGLALIVSSPNVPYYGKASAKRLAMQNISTEGEENSAHSAKFEMLRDQYLKSWQNLTFQPVFSTYVKKDSVKGYGVYEPHQSNVFAPGETIELYIEPVGYSFSRSQKDNNTYSIDFSADTVVSEPSGREVTALRGIPAGNMTTHHKNTEAYLVLTLTPSQGVPEGDYVITYIVKDNHTGKVFNMVKNIRLGTGLQSKQILR